MQLSTEQIQFIVETLELNNVIYEDVKHEILDHIASDIEKHIENDSLDFENSFYLVFKKWEQALQPSRDEWWLGNYFEGPKIVVEKWVSNSKKQLFSALFFSFFFGVILLLFCQNQHEEKTLKIINHIVQATFSLSVLITGVSYILIWKAKITTSYSRLFKRRSLLAIYSLSMGLGISKFYLYNENFTTSFLNIFLTLLFFFYDLLNNKMTLEHFKVLKKYKGCNY